MSAKGKKATATKASKDPSPVASRRTPVRSPIDDGARAQLFPLSSSQRRRSGSPLLTGLLEPAPKRRKAKEPVLSAEMYVPDPNLGSRIEQAMCDGLDSALPAHTAKEGAKGPSAASTHNTDKESKQGSSSVSFAHTAKESVKGSGAGKESVQGSSPANLASSGIYSEKSAKSGKDKWGDLLEEDTSKEDAKGLTSSDDGWVTTDEDEDESPAEAEAAAARKRRSDSIVDVHSSSEHKEGTKGPGSASKADNMKDETQGSSSEPKEIAKGSEASSESKETPLTLSAKEIVEELHRE
jgi:hypothetical protein